MREAGEIVNVRDGYAEIRMNANNSCPSCGARGMCRINGTQHRLIRLPLNEMKYRAGDRVEIETPARSLLTASFLVFILPLILSSLAYFIVYLLKHDQSWALVGFFACFVLSEALLVFLDRWFGHSHFFQPHIIDKTPTK
jgi:positive regulator of sigma E activity